MPHSSVGTGLPEEWISTASSPKAWRTLKGPITISNTTSLMNTVIHFALSPAATSPTPDTHQIISHVQVEKYRHLQQARQD